MQEIISVCVCVCVCVGVIAQVSYKVHGTCSTRLTGLTRMLFFPKRQVEDECW